MAVSSNIFNWNDEETVERQLEEYPLKEGYYRAYTDHTGRFFNDYSPEEWEIMKSDPFLKILQEEITKEINKQIIETIAKNVRV